MQRTYQLPLTSRSHLAVPVRVDDDCIISLLAFAVHPLRHHVIVIIYDNVDDLIIGVLPLRDHVLGVCEGFLSVSFSGDIAERAFIEVIFCHCSSCFSSYTEVLLEHGSHTSLWRRTTSDFQKHEEREY